MRSDAMTLTCPRCGASFVKGAGRWDRVPLNLPCAEIIGTASGGLPVPQAGRLLRASRTPVGYPLLDWKSCRDSVTVPGLGEARGALAVVGQSREPDAGANTTILGRTRRPAPDPAARAPS